MENVIYRTGRRLASRNERPLFVDSVLACRVVDIIDNVQSAFVV
jgi:hypothetical protein